MKFSDEELVDALFKYVTPGATANALGVKRQNLAKRVNTMLVAGVELPVKPLKPPRKYTPERVNALNEYIRQKGRPA